MVGLIKGLEPKWRSRVIFCIVLFPLRVLSSYYLLHEATHKFQIMCEESGVHF